MVDMVDVGLGFPVEQFTQEWENWLSVYHKMSCVPRTACLTWFLSFILS